MLVLDWHKSTEFTNNRAYLKAHRDWVEEYKAGFGDRALNAMWHYIFTTKQWWGVPDKAKLLEIGVYKGATLALWGMIGQQIGKDFDIYGLTKLDTEMADEYHTHEPISQEVIDSVLDHFGAKATIINADSRDDDVPVPDDLDLLFIDGGHDYATVVNDIQKYVPKVKPGGLVVFDDVAPDDPSYDHWFRGLEGVTQAVTGFAENHKEVLRCGYVRVYEA
jgi:predicted O-methyltransferase YrrM